MIEECRRNNENITCLQEVLFYRCNSLFVICDDDDDDDDDDCNCSLSAGKQHRVAQYF
jgi:hypothetical protein